jgi:hypothetical protein
MMTNSSINLSSLRTLIILTAIYGAFWLITRYM